jgi:hypothetical protein
VKSLKALYAWISIYTKKASGEDMDQTVLITPLGWERDRASFLAQDLRVHKAYLLYRTDHEENHKFVDMVKKDLKEIGTEVKLVELTNTREFESVMFNVSKIIVEEHKKQNIVYVNMSASGKIAAAASTIAAMFHKDKIKSLIYVSASRYAFQDEDPKKAFNEHGLVIGTKGRYSPPLFHIERPKEPILGAIVELYEKGPMKYGKLLETLTEHKVPGFESVNYPPTSDFNNRKLQISKWTGRLRRRILDPADKYIEIVPSHEGPEKVVRLTREGEHLAILTGMVSALK